MVEDTQLATLLLENLEQFLEQARRFSLPNRLEIVHCSNRVGVPVVRLQVIDADGLTARCELPLGGWDRKEA